MDLYTFIGLVGFTGYVTSYALLQLGMLDGNGISYTLANVVAASMVLVSMLEQFNLASALIQVSWISFGLIGLALRLTRNSAAASVEPQIRPQLTLVHGERSASYDQGAAIRRLVKGARSADAIALAESQ